MGRKIPGKKHRGIRNIEKQNQLRHLSLKNKINAPPAHPDDQDIPKSLSLIIELKDKVKSGEISLRHKRKHKGKPRPVTNHPSGIKQRFGKFDKPTSVFTQNGGESDKNLMRKVSSIVKEPAFENKYRNDDQRNTYTAEVENIYKRRKDELQVLIKQTKKDLKQNGKKKNILKTDSLSLTKSQKWEQKLKDRKLRKANFHAGDSRDREDHVKFGEVVHAPPTLSAPRKVSAPTETPRPGKKNLLLKSIIEPKGEMKVIKRKTLVDKLKHKTNKVIDRKAKRKDLPSALRRQLDKQQEEVVKAYKLLKSKKYNVK